MKDDFCCLLNLFHDFCRRHLRPNFRKHRSTSKAGWKHLECNECNQLERNIKREDDEVKRRDLQNVLKKHKNSAWDAKQKYYNTRSKASKNLLKGDISMIIDAGGGSGCSNIPRFQSTEKSEPARHLMLKIKSTFIKIHGIGSLLVVTNPDIEKQGGNLTVECILRAMVFAMKQSNLNKMRNLYIQLDNVSSNKCYSIISSMVALAACGICKKIKINYLVVGHTHEDIDGLIGILTCIPNIN